jgi:hypothetical protein
VGESAFGAAVALAVPSVAAANEVTKWNEITVGTVNTQSSPLVSAAPTRATFLSSAGMTCHGAYSVLVCESSSEKACW